MIENQEPQTNLVEKKHVSASNNNTKNDLVPINTPMLSLASVTSSFDQIQPIFQQIGPPLSQQPQSQNQNLETDLSSQFKNNSWHQKNVQQPKSNQSKPSAIVISVTDDQLEYLEEKKVADLITNKLNAQISNKSVVQNRLYVYPLTEKDSVEIMKINSQFFPNCERRTLTTKRLAIILHNITCYEIETDPSIKNSLIKSGITSWEPLMINKHECKSLKCYFDAKDKMVLFLRNHYANDWRVLDSKSTSIEIGVEPDVYNPIQCFKCYQLGHIKKDCPKNKTTNEDICPHCCRYGHQMESCIKLSLKCATCGCAHSSLDRKCQTYKDKKRAIQNKGVSKLLRNETVKNTIKNRSLTTELHTQVSPVWT